LLLTDEPDDFGNKLEILKNFSFKMNEIFPKIEARFSSDTDVKKMGQVVKEFVEIFNEDIYVGENYDFKLKEFVEM
jgi:hypothetical protein